MRCAPLLVAVALAALACKKDKPDHDCTPEDEVCDGRDNDCDGDVDEDATDAIAYYPDADGDGFGDDALESLHCDIPTDLIETGFDCDDANAAIRPGALELCDEIDSDCDDDLADAAATFVATDGGALTDYSAQFSSGTSDLPSTVEVIEAGTLTVCPGTHYVKLTSSAEGPVVIESKDGAATTTLDAGSDGANVHVTALGMAVQVRGLTLLNGVSEVGAIASNDGDITLDGCIVTGAAATTTGAIHTGFGQITLTGTQITGASSDSSIVVTASGDVVCADSTISGSDGGAIATIDGDIEVTNCTISENVGAASALSTESGDVTVTGSLFDANASTAPGGAISTDSGDVTVDTSEFIDNSSSGDGGAIAVSAAGAHVGLNDCTLTGNTAQHGGGIYAASSNVDLDLVLASGNTATFAGGLAYIGTGNFLGKNSTFDGNSADDGAGGVAYAAEGSLAFDGSTANGNGAQDGSVAWTEDGNVLVANSLLNSNTASGVGTIGSAVGNITCAGDPEDLVGLVGNQGGGAVLGNGTLNSTACDWGPPETSEDNDPWDVRVVTQGDYAGFGTDASFTCTTGGGCP